MKTSVKVSIHSGSIVRASHLGVAIRPLAPLSLISILISNILLLVLGLILIG